MDGEKVGVGVGELITGKLEELSRRRGNEVEQGTVERGVGVPDVGKGA